MRMVPLLALLALPSAAWAMNWEGHDDWMADHPAAVALERAAGDARPLPPTPCDKRLSPGRNPYEQVPLAHHPCQEPAPEPQPRR